MPTTFQAKTIIDESAKRNLALHEYRALVRATFAEVVLMLFGGLRDADKLDKAILSSLRVRADEDEWGLTVRAWILVDVPSSVVPL